MKDLIKLFEYTFFTNALLAGVFSSIIAAIAGSYVVSRKIVFVSGGITHASFGGIGIAYFLGLNPFIGAIIFGVLSALGIEYTTQKGGISEDSAIAILWSFGMAIGIIFMTLTPGYTPNLIGFLFGNILTVTYSDLIFMGIVAFAIVVLTIVFYRPILYVAYDEKYARSTGINVTIIKYSIAIFIALSIILSIYIAGIILVLSLFTIPQAIARLFTDNFKQMIYLSGIFSFRFTYREYLVL